MILFKLINNVISDHTGTYPTTVAGAAGGGGPLSSPSAITAAVVVIKVIDIVISLYTKFIFVAVITIGRQDELCVLLSSLLAINTSYCCCWDWLG
jgi:hypothetical protein